ncbi:hypothetical protein SDRG_04312 [Saprolegnia diclina VS20]|uniref:Homeobox domain-containing protein n=1 Tax=Saprolegnia diclina (strain VS20) TaxID=1156394 RepID=T0QVB7_SAPDV|nr:hypothetical protein SDRG_04312 [Saprolegnia diclina VS20]EQC38611.1 hypothetical protein SDRG_04312 [Saprolegnia diclina VS20]|eukprot:XP_008608203.1 hypothetical protein SDRG_04312 [Saprolegnia diclina VS20]
MTLPNHRPPAPPSAPDSPLTAAADALSFGSDGSRDYEDATADTLLGPTTSITDDIASTLTHLAGDPVWAAMAPLFAPHMTDLLRASSTKDARATKCLEELKMVLATPSGTTRDLCDRYTAALDQALEASPPTHKAAKKRTNLSKVAKRVLRTWFDAHFHHPYPTDEEKEVLSAQGGITIEQVNNWFINTRVREWKPKLHQILAENAAGNTHTLDAMLDKVKEPYKL